ncbi:L-dopachrome tautomerase-related protein [Methylobacterium tarhaniae]|uniref:L-dopachrome tautomerase-related protein n=1 Tax=Methylobacterium tarhaniae TaxID=1187852 RepID=UPI003CFEBE00
MSGEAMIDRRAWLTGASALLAAGPGRAGEPVRPGASPPALTLAFALPDAVTNGVAVTPKGRIFAALARIDGSAGPRVVEIRDGRPVPFPDEAWNAFVDGADPTRTLIWVNSLRIGPDGDLWLVDTGSPGFGRPMRPGGCKLVQIDVAGARVRRTIPLNGVVTRKSFIDDVRFNDGLAYLTDAGAPALVVLDLATGGGRRVLEGHPSVTASRPISAEGRIVRGPDGTPVHVHADQLEVSPDGATLFYQSCTGPLWRVPTRLLDDPRTAPATLAASVEIVADTPPTGGTAIGADGTLFVSDTDTQRIVLIAPDGSTSTLIQDPRLLWVDAMWIDSRRRLWLPAAQLNRLALFQGGRSRVRFPVEVYTLQLEVGPAPNDHR